MNSLAHLRTLERLAENEYKLDKYAEQKGNKVEWNIVPEGESSRDSKCLDQEFEPLATIKLTV